jgi:hypothetical protein
MDTICNKSEQTEQILKFRSKIQIAEKSRLSGEPTVSLNEARKRIEKKYAEMK